mgnify:CR=1 FL=1
MKYNDNSSDMSRDKVIVKTSVVGIAANVLLAALKAVIGLLSNSIAIVLDAVNNISDAASSVITIIGTKLAGKAPNKKHPFGYGRIEYLTAMIISVIVLYAGITSFIESVKKIINPEVPEYSKVSIIIIAVAVLVKIVLGRYVKSVGEKVNSTSLINSGQDAVLDSIISFSTLVAAIIYLLKGISVEAWLGAFISVIIIKSGIDMLKEAISSILGERADAELAAKIKKTVCSFDGVYGAYDLVLNNYGPDTFNGSVHIEVPDTYSADELDVLIRRITEKVFLEHNVILTAIGVYSRNTTDERAVQVREEVEKLVLGNEYVLQMHGFNLNEERKIIRFDVVVSFDAKSREKVYSNIIKAVKSKYPEYEIRAVLDTDFSEE